MKIRREKNNHATVVIFAVITLVAAFVIYDILLGPHARGADEALVSETSGEPGTAEVFSILDQVESLKLDTAIFKDPAFMSLVDNTVTINPEPVGRPNPFAPR